MKIRSGAILLSFKMILASAANKALNRMQTTLRFVFTAQLKRYVLKRINEAS